MKRKSFTFHDYRGITQKRVVLEGSIVLWYIDMIADWSKDRSGKLYFDDLYLDLVVYPDGRVFRDDQEELEAALRQGEIDQRLYKQAMMTCETLEKGMLKESRRLVKETMRCYKQMQHNICGMHQR